MNHQGDHVAVPPSLGVTRVAGVQTWWGEGSGVRGLEVRAEGNGEKGQNLDDGKKEGKGREKRKPSFRKVFDQKHCCE